MFCELLQKFSSTQDDNPWFLPASYPARGWAFRLAEDLLSNCTMRMDGRRAAPDGASTFAAVELGSLAGCSLPLCSRSVDGTLVPFAAYEADRPVRRATVWNLSTGLQVDDARATVSSNALRPLVAAGGVAQQEVLGVLEVDDPLVWPGVTEMWVNITVGPGCATTLGRFQLGESSWTAPMRISCQVEQAVEKMTIALAHTTTKQIVLSLPPPTMGTAPGVVATVRGGGELVPPGGALTLDFAPTDAALWTVVTASQLAASASSQRLLQGGPESCDQEAGDVFGAEPVVVVAAGAASVTVTNTLAANTLVAICLTLQLRAAAQGGLDAAPVTVASPWVGMLAEHVAQVDAGSKHAKAAPPAPPPPPGYAGVYVATQARNRTFVKVHRTFVKVHKTSVRQQN